MFTSTCGDDPNWLSRVHTACIGEDSSMFGDLKNLERELRSYQPQVSVEFYSTIDILTPAEGGMTGTPKYIWKTEPQEVWLEPLQCGPPWDRYKWSYGAPISIGEISPQAKPLIFGSTASRPGTFGNVWSWSVATRICRGVGPGIFDLPSGCPVGI